MGKLLLLDSLLQERIHFCCNDGPRYGLPLHPWSHDQGLPSQVPHRQELDLQVLFSCSPHPSSTRSPRCSPLRLTRGTQSHRRPRVTTKADIWSRIVYLAIAFLE